jgi:hypothetical protein
VEHFRLSVTIFLEFCHSFYELVNDYMELHFLHVLEPPRFISTAAFGGKLKYVTILLSQLNHLLPVANRVKELPVRKLLEWLWWKFAFHLAPCKNELV